ncbi:MAG: LytTR family transcriptional regulator [Clostridia bacterium]|nr:LytTR family transcriptional regulator [Clostridia bacterium]
MKLKIEIGEGLEKEVVLRAPAFDDDVRRIQRAIEKASSSGGEIALKNSGGEIYVSYSEICFFEANEDRVYAQTPSSCYVCPMRLSELEELLPRAFCRASKSVLINTAKIRSLTRSPTGVGEAVFAGTEKTAFISRMYYKIVRETIEETRLSK